MRRVAATSTLGIFLAAGLASPVAAYDDPPPVELRLPGPAREGQDQTFTGTLRVRCAIGDEVSSSHLSFAQHGAGSSEREVESLPACTGAWEPVGYTSGEGYLAGRSATVTVDDSGATKVVDLSRELWVRPAAKVRFADKAVLLDNGSVRARVWIRCDAPWYDYASLVGVDQGATHAEAGVVEDVDCDGDYHPPGRAPGSRRRKVHAGLGTGQRGRDARGRRPRVGPRDPHEPAGVGRARLTKIGGASTRIGPTLRA